MSAIIPCLISALALASCTHASPPPLDDVFDVLTGDVAGSCDEKLPLLRTMFTEIQNMNQNALDQMSEDNYNSNAHTRNLAQSMFAMSYPNVHLG